MSKINVVRLKELEIWKKKKTNGRFTSGAY